MRRKQVKRQRAVAQRSKPLVLSNGKHKVQSLTSISEIVKHGSVVSRKNLLEKEDYEEHHSSVAVVRMKQSVVYKQQIPTVLVGEQQKYIQTKLYDMFEELDCYD